MPSPPPAASPVLVPSPSPVRHPTPQHHGGRHHPNIHHCHQPPYILPNLLHNMDANISAVRPLMETLHLFIVGEVVLVMVHLRRWKDSFFFSNERRLFDVKTDFFEYFGLALGVEASE
ncbi:hypothetical protein QJS10_CPA10g01779 [Acorus calamus]|uniref:Uncharacterized protein n=1 Tax=Acorus calamus TaxID=4465 RepID=A0AAV9E0K5_ACOCL|nr:hypothetical protein QJS10_CPA10g01779 [Acorus calamus]